MKKIAIIVLFTHSLIHSLTPLVYAQKPTGEIDSQTFEIEKKKRIELPPANRLYNKIQPFTNPEDEKKAEL